MLSKIGRSWLRIATAFTRGWRRSGHKALARLGDDWIWATTTVATIPGEAVAGDAGQLYLPGARASHASLQWCGLAAVSCHLSSPSSLHISFDNGELVKEKTEANWAMLDNCLLPLHATAASKVQYRSSHYVQESTTNQTCSSLPVPLCGKLCSHSRGITARRRVSSNSTSECVRVLRQRRFHSLGLEE